MNKDIAVFRYRTVFISDLHLGSGKTAAPYLYEFLGHLDFDTLKDLYLVGDIIGGWEHQNNRQQPLSEMERRILDVLNFAASKGVHVHFLPGNHDEKLRPLLPQLQGRRGFKTFGRNIEFINETFYSTSGDKGLRIKIVHGDQHDPDLFVKPWFKPVTFMTSAVYDGMVNVNYHVSNTLYKNFGMHVSFAKALKNAFKRSISFLFSHESVLRGLRDESFDGVLMGHTHMAGIQEFDERGRQSYLINCGDWVESATAAVVGPEGGLPQILHYKTEREKRGFGALPELEDAHPTYFAAFRAQTDRQVRMMHRLWPARNRSKHFERYVKARLKLSEYHRDSAALDTVLNVLDKTGVLTPQIKTDLEAVVLRAKSEVYKAQKTGLSAIFDRYTQNAKLLPDDLVYVKTVAREFKTRSERKIRKHKETMSYAAIALDLPCGTRKATTPSTIHPT